MKNLSILFLACGILFSGCGSLDVEPKVEKVKSKNIEPKVIVQDSNIPKWINNPDIDGYIGAVGIVKKMKNKKKQKYIAKKLAIASLQEQKRVMFESKITKRDSELIQEIKQTSSHYNSYDIIQKAEFSDEENYYVWMVIKK